MKMIKSSDFCDEEILKECENLEFLNKHADYLRETEYRIILILCGHTRHGKVSLQQVKHVLEEYWKMYNQKTHLNNIEYILSIALRKIKTNKLFMETSNLW